MSVKDAQTITVTTIDPRPTLPGLLTSPATAITDAAAADAAGEGNFIAAGALTGPYIPTEYILEERLSSVANDGYWGGTPPLAGIEHLAIPDTNSRELALQAGDIDVAINVSPTGAQVIDSQPGMHSQTAGIGTSVVMWWVNFERDTLADPLVRPGGGPRHRPGEHRGPGRAGGNRVFRRAAAPGRLRFMPRGERAGLRS